MASPAVCAVAVEEKDTWSSWTVTKAGFYTKV